MKKKEMKLNSLKDTVDILGRQLETMQIKESLTCHAKYTSICVTPVEYNSSRFPWYKIQSHLQGIWDNANTSLDLKEFQQHIQDIMNAHKLDTTLATRAQDFVQTLKATFPSFSYFQKGFYGVCFMIVLLLVGLVLVPCVLRIVIHQLQAIKIEIKKVKLEQMKHKPPPPLT